jgi:tellurite resistance protein
MNTPTPSPRPSLITRAIARLEHLAPAWFAMVMGWCGLSLAWLRATDVLGDTALGLGLVGAMFALLVFVLLCLACVVRLTVHPNAVAADMRHPVRHAFMATLPLSLMLLAGIGVSLFWHTSRTLDTLLTFAWVLGSVLELAASVWVLARWLNTPDNGGLQWAAFTPVFFIPVIGNVLAPLAGLTLGLESWATAQFGIGLLLWPVLQTMLIIRMAQAGPLSARMSPSIFITMVAPSIIGLCFLQLDAPLSLAWGSWGIGLFFLMLSLTQIHTILEQPFGLPHWAMSFPMAAFTTLSLRMSQAQGGAWMELPATLLLAITSLIILGLTLNTWRGLRHGHLLMAEK